MSFPQFGEVIEEDFPQFGEVMEESEEVSPKKPTLAEKIAPQFKAYGWQPEPEAVQKVLHPVAVGMKGFTKGTFGTPGDILNFLQNIVGVENPKTILPTSETIGNIFDKLADEKFEPENLAEEVAERGFEFLGSMFGLGGMAKGSSALKSLGKNILRAFVPGGVSVAGEKLDLPPWMQVASVIGTSLLTHRFTGKSLKDVERGLYSQARELASDTKVDATKMSKNLGKLGKRISSGGTAPSETQALTKIKELENAIKDGKASVNELMDFKRKINEIRSSLFAKDLGKAGVKTAKRNLNAVASEVDDAIKSFKNPQFQEIYKDANSLHKGMADTNKIFKFIDKNKQLSGLGSVMLKYFFPSVLKPAGAVAGAGQVWNFASSLLKNPGYRKAYWDVLKSAMKEDVKGTAAALKRFNKKTEKEFGQKIED